MLAKVSGVAVAALFGWLGVPAPAAVPTYDQLQLYSAVPYCDSASTLVVGWVVVNNSDEPLTLDHASAVPAASKLTYPPGETVSPHTGTSITQRLTVPWAAGTASVTVTVYAATASFILTATADLPSTSYCQDPAHFPVVVNPPCTAGCSTPAGALPVATTKPPGAATATASHPAVGRPTAGTTSGASSASPGPPNSAPAVLAAPSTEAGGRPLTGQESLSADAGDGPVLVLTVVGLLVALGLATPLVVLLRRRRSRRTGERADQPGEPSAASGVV